MYYIGVNKNTNLADFLPYSDNPLSEDNQYIYFNLENPSDYLWRKYENGKWSEEKYPPPEPTPEPSIGLEERLKNAEETILFLMDMNLGGM